MAIMDNIPAMTAYMNCQAHFQAYSSSGSVGRGPENTLVRSDELNFTLRSCSIDTKPHAMDSQKTLSTTDSARGERWAQPNHRLNDIARNPHKQPTYES